MAKSFINFVTFEVFTAMKTQVVTFWTMTLPLHGVTFQKTTNFTYFAIKSRNNFRHSNLDHPGASVGEALSSITGLTDYSL
jgi:hypothetical protein